MISVCALLSIQFHSTRNHIFGHLVESISCEVSKRQFEDERLTGEMSYFIVRVFLTVTALFYL